MPTIPQDSQLLKELFSLLQNHREIFKQERTYQRVVALVLAELFVFARHTVTQLLMSLGQTDQDWSAWYRLFSQKRFDYDRASDVMMSESLRHVGEDELYVVVGMGRKRRAAVAKWRGQGGCGICGPRRSWWGFMRPRDGSMAVG